ncbi:MAG: WbqC family protein [Caldilineaceae bacterium]|nr:WbqC family protein [Caldilineaceae bacterium]
MNCAIIQPSYIPWRGYFHQIWKSDIFIFYDDVQYDKHGWRNRNRIKTAQGVRWLTIPVRKKGNVTQGIPINEIQIDPTSSWAQAHWKTLQQSYSKSPYFERYAPILEEFYSARPEMLSDYVIDLTLALARELGIQHTRFLRSSELAIPGSRTARLVEILTHVGASHYISGPSARSYMEEDLLAAANLTLEYMVYEYPEYEQLYPPYEWSVSVLDLLFMKGPDAGRYIWGDIAQQHVRLQRADLTQDRM